jgi:FMN phosphatase YigB (HAD superfamily)
LVDASPPAPRGVTFDFWFTLFLPHPDVPEHRVRLLADWLGAPIAAVQDVLAEGFELHAAEALAGRQWGPRELAELLLRRLPDRRDEDTERRVRELASLVERGSSDIGARPVGGAMETIVRLRRAGVRLGIVCNTGFSPGRVLRGFLDRAGMLPHFESSALAFSDEVRVPKPDPRIFRAALAGLGISPDQAVHVGSHRATDVAGARATGLRTVRFMGAHDDVRAGPEADVVIARLPDLLAALDLRLSGPVRWAPD